LVRPYCATGTEAMTIAVVSPKDNPALRAMPHDRPDLKFLVGNTREDLLAQEGIAGAEGLLFVPPGDPAVLSEIFPRMPKVRWCHSFFAGVDALAPFVTAHLMKPNASGVDVPLTNGRGAFSDSLAEWVMATALHFNKQMPRVVRNRQERRWDKFVMNTVAGKSIGFVGFGHIGQTTAKMAKAAFNMRVLALRRRVELSADDRLADVTYGPDEKLELFRNSDFVVCVLPGTPDTSNFCSINEFAAMKRDAAFISIGRGLAVDEDALANALLSKQIGGAAIDVFKQEPLPKESKLWDCENLILTAHNADFTESYFELGWSVWRNNLDGLRSGSGLVTPVDKRAGY